MTPNARRIVAKRKQRSDEVFARNEKIRLEELHKNPVRQWYPAARERDYLRAEDLRLVNPGESHD